MPHSELIRRPQRVALALAEAANDPVLTMSSREIADLTGKDHKNVLRDIRTMLAALDGHGSELSHHREEADSRGYTKMVHLDRGLTDTLLTGYSVPLRYRVVQRWRELEQAGAPTFAVPATLSEALRLAADQAELIEQQQVLIAKQAPQVAALHRIALTATDTSLCLTDAAKHLQIAPRKIIPWLIANGWAYKRTEDSRLCAMQDRLDRGYLSHKIVEFDGSGGEKRQATQVRVMQKGLVKLAHRLATGKGVAP